MCSASHICANVVTIYDPIAFNPLTRFAYEKFESMKYTSCSVFVFQSIVIQQLLLIPVWIELEALWNARTRLHDNRRWLSHTDKRKSTQQWAKFNLSLVSITKHPFLHYFASFKIDFAEFWAIGGSESNLSIDSWNLKSKWLCFKVFSFCFARRPCDLRL